MTRRPLPIAILSCLLVLTGIVGLVYHARDFRAGPAFRWDVLGIALVRVLAIVAGVYLFLGNNWARWLAITWIAFHVVISMFHSIGQVGFHILILALFAYFLFRPRATAFFGRWDGRAGGIGA